MPRIATLAVLIPFFSLAAGAQEAEQQLDQAENAKNALVAQAKEAVGQYVSSFVTDADKDGAVDRKAWQCLLRQAQNDRFKNLSDGDHIGFDYPWNNGDGEENFISHGDSRYFVRTNFHLRSRKSADGTLTPQFAVFSVKFVGIHWQNEKGQGAQRRLNDYVKTTITDGDGYFVFNTSDDRYNEKDPGAVYAASALLKGTIKRWADAAVKAGCQ